MSVFHQHVRIGEQCIVSGMSAARQDVLPYSKSAGRPVAPHGINSVGLKRRDFTHEYIKNLVNFIRTSERGISGKILSSNPLND